MSRLFEVSKGTKPELPILFDVFYGLRRSEAISLKWDALDFENETLTVKHRDYFGSDIKTLVAVIKKYKQTHGAHNKDEEYLNERV